MLDLRAVAEACCAPAGVERIEHVDLCTSCREDLFFSHRRDGGVTGRQGGLVWRSLDARRACARTSSACASRSGTRSRSAPRSSTSTLEDLPALAEAGITLVGENRAQELRRSRTLHGDLFEWDFIGALQSRKVKDVAPRVRLIHSVASESALAQLEKHPAREVLIQVNVAGEEGKAGIAPAELGGLHRPLPVAR